MHARLKQVDAARGDMIDLQHRWSNQALSQPLLFHQPSVRADRARSSTECRRRSTWVARAGETAPLRPRGWSPRSRSVRIHWPSVCSRYAVDVETDHRKITAAGWSYRTNERGWTIYREPQTGRWYTRAMQSVRLHFRIRAGAGVWPLSASPQVIIQFSP